MPLVGGCAGTGGLTPSATTTTAMVGWERWLRLDWTSQARRGGQEIDGYVYSSYGSAIYEVRLLAQGLDAAGNVVTQKIETMPGIVPGLQRAYFRIGGLPPAARYRVSVWSFESIEGKGFF
jgi:hypothetical protein